MEIEISKNLKSILDSKGISLTALSKHTGVPISTLNNWLSGQEPRSLVQVRTVASFLGFSIEELCFPRHNQQTETHSPIETYQDEINAGVFEVILRRPKGKK